MYDLVRFSYETFLCSLARLVSSSLLGIEVTVCVFEGVCWDLIWVPTNETCCQ
jgi:hypothetical protein